MGPARSLTHTACREGRYPGIVFYSEIFQARSRAQTACASKRTYGLCQHTHDLCALRLSPACSL